MTTPGCDAHAGASAELRDLARTALDRVEPVLDRLRIEPCIPPSWPGFSINWRRGVSGQATTVGRSAPRRFTTMREEAHISASGDFPRMPQQAVVISGTSWPASISGNSTSRDGSKASTGTLSFANSMA